LVLALGAGGYLLAVARAWEERAEEVDGIARDLGAELAAARGDLEETQGTLALVERQLEGAQEQIHELADTVARTGDDREVQRQVNEYQAELFAAAAGVTGTMSQCKIGRASCRERVEISVGAGSLETRERNSTVSRAG